MWEDYDWRCEPPERLEAEARREMLLPVILEYAASVHDSQRGGDLASWTLSAVADTLFLHAVMSGDIPAIKRLVDAGCNINAYDLWGRSALHLVPTDEVAEVLFAYDPEVRVIDRLFRTPLHYAASKGLFRTARRLLGVTGDANFADAYSERPLHMAAHGGHERVATLLVYAGADIKAKNEWGQPPGEIFKFEHNHVPEILTKPGPVLAGEYDGTLFGPDSDPERPKRPAVHFM